MNWPEVACIAVISGYAAFLLVNMFMLLTKRRAESGPSPLELLPVTVIIPCRNEEENIIACLDSILKQDYPPELLEVIVVDDHSEDRTAELAAAFLAKNFCNAAFLRLENNKRGKKAALLKAISQAKGALIVTRDADTFGPDTYWLRNISREFLSTGCDLLIMPTLLQGKKSFLFTFQQFENLALNSLGMSMSRLRLPFVCSGANLAYKKTSFLQADPYHDNLQIASGDDMFALKAFYKKGFFIKEAGAEQKAYTKAESSVRTAFFQRVRWASKSGKISIFPVYLAGFLVAGATLACAVLLLLSIINSHYSIVGLLCLGLKLIIDFLLLFLGARMFKQKVTWSWLPLAFLVNCLYVPLTILASAGCKPTWKSRRV